MKVLIRKIRPASTSGPICCLIFFFNDPATTEIYTLSLHDALPISSPPRFRRSLRRWATRGRSGGSPSQQDRKSTRLNSSHSSTSYAVFCLKKKSHLSPHTDKVMAPHRYTPLTDRHLVRAFRDTIAP